MEKRKILVVESKSFPLRELNEHLLHLDFLVVDSVSSGHKALLASDKHRPDLLLVTLGDEEDLALIQIVEQIKKNYPIPTVFISKLPGTYLFHRAKKTSPVNYLFFPLSPTELEIALEFAVPNHV